MRPVSWLALLLVAACSGKSEPRMQNADTLTQRQRDSVVGASGLRLRDAGGSGQAAQDSANARAARTDSATQATTP